MGSSAPQTSTIKQKLALKYHPHYATLQRATDGRAWYTTNVGQLLPHFEDIEVEYQKEPLPAIGAHGSTLGPKLRVSC